MFNIIVFSQQKWKKVGADLVITITSLSSVCLFILLPFTGMLSSTLINIYEAL